MELLSPSLGLIFWQLVGFLILLFVLSKFAWKPILHALREREATIEDALATAEKTKKEMAELKAENEKLLAEARKERDRILKDATAAANHIREEAKAQTAKDTARMIEDARVTIETEKQAALAEVKQQVAALSVQVAEKILRAQLGSEQAQKEYVSKLIKDLNVN